MNSNSRITKAMLLSAGFGTRLRPLTYDTPKPLLPLDGEILIDHQLRYLKRYGIEEVMINLHHLGDKIERHVEGGANYGLKIFYSKEEPEILGTGGGIKKASDFFAGEPFVVLNSDALIDVDLDKLIKHHFNSNSMTTMVLKKLEDGDNYTPVGVDDDGYITEFGNGNFYYTGLQVLNQEILDALPPKGTPACLVKDGYEILLEKGISIAAYIYDGYWNDIGTMERYEEILKDISTGKFKLLK